MQTWSHDDNPSLRLVNINKAYDPVRVLDQVHLSVQRGEVVALMGANGATASWIASAGK